MEKQKYAIPFVLAAAVSAAFALFLRWLEIQNLLDIGTGLMERGVHAISIIFCAYMILCVIAVFIALKMLKKKGLAVPPDTRAIADEGKVIRIIMIVLAVVMVVYCALQILSAETLLTRIFTTVAAFGGLLLATRLNSSLRGFGKAADCVLLLAGMLWVVNIYWSNKNNPDIRSYAMELVAACFIVLFIVSTSDFRFGGSGSSSVFFGFLSVTFSGAALGERAEDCMSVLFIVMALCALCYLYVILKNLMDASELQAEIEAAKAAEAEEEAVKKEEKAAAETEESKEK